MLAFTAFTLGLVGTCSAFTLGLLPGLQLALLYGPLLGLFTLGLSLFTLAFTAFTRLTFSGRDGIRAGLLFAPDPVLPLTFLADESGFVFTLFTSERRLMLTAFTHPLLTRFLPVLGRLRAGLRFGPLVGLQARTAVVMARR